jgi:hypothetical protein
VDAVVRFATEAVAFRDWAARGTDAGEVAARNALLHITRLYLAALELPPAWSEELSDQPDAERIGNAEWGEVFGAARRLPLDYYAAACDPLYDPVVGPHADSAGIGSLSDDIADIYRDVVSGLRAFETGRRAAAVWEWGFGFRHHWGEHATGAIQALHAWMAANAFDRLASDTEPRAPVDGEA